MLKYQILFNYNGTVCVCTTLANGHCWGYTYTEEQAQQRVADLSTIGVQAWYEPIAENHPVNTDAYKD